MKNFQTGFVIDQIARLAPDPTKDNRIESKRLYKHDNLKEFAIDFFNCHTTGKTSYVNGIFRVGIANYLLSKGIYKRKINREWYIVRDEHSVIKVLQLHDIYEIFDKYFEEQGEYYNYNDGEVYITSPLKTILLREIYLVNKDQIINKNLLHSLTEHTKTLIVDTKDVAHLIFSNGVMIIEADDTQFLSYEQLLIDKCIFRTSIINHKLKHTTDYEDSDYSSFIKNVFQHQAQAARSSIGYLLHQYNNPGSMPIVLMYDEALTAKNSPEGRTGKGIFAKALSKVSVLERIDGKRINPDKFSLERVTDDTRIVFIDDVRKDFDIDSLNSSSTEGLSFNRKFKTEIYFNLEDTPKILISSNHILATEGITREHRQYILEFGNYYSSRISSSVSTPVKDVHGRMLFDDWDDAEWNRFFSYMIDSVQLFLKGGLIKPVLKNVYENRLRQTTSTEILEWIESFNWELDKEYNSKTIYEEFLSQTAATPTAQRNLTDTLKKYAKNQGWKFINLNHSKFKLVKN